MEVSEDGETSAPLATLPDDGPNGGFLPSRPADSLVMQDERKKMKSGTFDGN
jgi:hypothetical protein